MDMCDNRNSNEALDIEGGHQLIDAAEVKQEPGIKEEPQPDGELDEFPAEDGRGNQRSFVDPKQLDGEDDSTDTTDDEVKVKEENVGKNEKESKSNDGNANVAAIDNQQNKQPSQSVAHHPKFNRKGTTACNAKKSTKVNARGNALKQHQCEQCEFTTRYKQVLNRHLLTHTGEKPFPCDHCTKTFTQQHSLKNHMKVHLEEFLFNCATCLKGFKQKNEKVEHESGCKKLRYECHLCKKSFGSMKANLIRHMCTHSGKKTFACTECSKQFTRKDHLKSHMALHAGPRSFRCSKCHQGFAQKDEMIAHEQKCIRRTYECYICGKSFDITKSNLDVHIRTHTGNKPFQCSQCLKKFAQKGHMVRHMKIHSRSLPWKCTICRQGFSKQSQCKAHQHNCSRLCYECFLCKKFIGSSIGNLKQHMVTHSGEKAFQCKMCRKLFTQKSNLTRHMKNIHNKKP